jgi:hypothetical protein
METAFFFIQLAFLSTLHITELHETMKGAPAYSIFFFPHICVLFSVTMEVLLTRRRTKEKNSCKNAHVIAFYATLNNRSVTASYVETTKLFSL